MSDMAATDYERFAHAALPHYGLDSATVTLLSYSENGTFLVESETGRQVLRVHRPGYHSLAAIESELDWMESLRRDSAITTPQVIPAPDGRRVVEARIGDETYLVDLFTFVEGTIAEDDASDISFSATPPKLSTGKADQVAATVTVGDSQLADWVDGKRGLRELYQKGDLRVDGNVTLVRQIEDAL